MDYQPNRLICGIKRASFGTHESLACILDMNHPGRVHQDRMGRTWELLVEYTPRAYHLDMVQRLITLHEGTLTLLEQFGREFHDAEGILRVADMAALERRRVHDTLVAMGLADTEPKGEAA